jgi:hypothetical protein
VSYIEQIKKARAKSLDSRIRKYGDIEERLPDNKTLMELLVKHRYLSGLDDLRHGMIMSMVNDDNMHILEACHKGGFIPVQKIEHMLELEKNNYAVVRKTVQINGKELKLSIRKVPDSQVG